MIYEYLCIIDDYISSLAEQLASVKDYDRLSSKDKELFDEWSTKKFFAEELRDAITERDYCDTVTIACFLWKYASHCLDMTSKYHISKSICIGFSPMTMWSNAYNVAMTFYDYLDFVGKEEVPWA